MFLATCSRCLASFVRVPKSDVCLMFCDASVWKADVPSIYHKCHSALKSTGAGRRQQMYLFWKKCASVKLLISLSTTRLHGTFLSTDIAATAPQKAIAQVQPLVEWLVLLLCAWGTVPNSASSVQVPALAICWISLRTNSFTVVCLVKLTCQKSFKAVVISLFSCSRVNFYY